MESSLTSPLALVAVASWLDRGPGAVADVPSPTTNKLLDTFQFSHTSHNSRIFHSRNFRALFTETLIAWLLGITRFTAPPKRIACKSRRDSQLAPHTTRLTNCNRLQWAVAPVQGDAAPADCYRVAPARRSGQVAVAGRTSRHALRSSAAPGRFEGAPDLSEHNTGKRVVQEPGQARPRHSTFGILTQSDHNSMPTRAAPTSHLVKVQPAEIQREPTGKTLAAAPHFEKSSKSIHTRLHFDFSPSSNVVDGRSLSNKNAHNSQFCL